MTLPILEQVWPLLSNAPASLFMPQIDPIARATFLNASHFFIISKVSNYLIGQEPWSSGYG